MHNLTDRKRVVVTGMGVVTPCGHGIEAFSQALREGVSGIRFIERLAELGFSCCVGGVPPGIMDQLGEYFAESEIISLNESIAYGTIAALDAFADAGLERTPRDGDTIHEDTGAIIGTGIGGIDTFGHQVYPKLMGGNIRRLGSSVVERIMVSGVSARVGGLLGLGGQVSSNSSACSTGNEAIIMGFERIRAGLASRMLVGGCEGSDPLVWCGFDAMRVLSKKHNETPHSASRPMSATAGGFVPGSGAGVLVIEELSLALNRGARIYGEILAGTVTCGGMRSGGSMTAPSPRGVRRCISNAIGSAGIDPHEIDYINGHLTATMADPREIANWAESLGLGAHEFPYINSTKSLIGHALGASGAIETVATLIQLSEGFLHPSLNCEDLHPDIASYEKSVVRERLEVPIHIAAKASFGFGDVNSCLIIKSWRNNNDHSRNL